MLPCFFFNRRFCDWHCFCSAFIFFLYTFKVRGKLHIEVISDEKVVKQMKQNKLITLLTLFLIGGFLAACGNSSGQNDIDTNDNDEKVHEEIENEDENDEDTEENSEETTDDSDQETT